MDFSTPPIGQQRTLYSQETVMDMLKVDGKWLPMEEGRAIVRAREAAARPAVHIPAKPEPGWTVAQLTEAGYHKVGVGYQTVFTGSWAGTNSYGQALAEAWSRDGVGGQVLVRDGVMVRLVEVNTKPTNGSSFYDGRSTRRG
jgi:hypothetical protein